MTGGFYGLIGERLGHSFSKTIHEALWAKDYRLIELSAQELGPFLEAREFAGINVTIPYKQAVIPYCDTIDPKAQAIGSVNTIVREPSGRLAGYNTDLDGLLFLARQAGISFRGRRVVILGTGGTSLTARAAAQADGAREVVCISRRGPDNYGNLERHRDGEILINTTPVGMFPSTQEAPCDLGAFPGLLGVLDVVYNPLRTRLVLQAQRLGIPAAGGLGMLVRQGVAAAELFCGRPFPPEDTMRILGQLWRERVNLVLVGMPGCGKSSVGRALAGRLGRPFLDVDEMVEQRAGQSIPELFATLGEAGFRALESDALQQACASQGAVIATGGGAVLDPENRLVMRASGRVIFLRRALGLLSTRGRPLSKGPRELEAMLKARLPLYRQVCDQEMDNSGPLAQTVQALQEDFQCAFSL